MPRTLANHKTRRNEGGRVGIGHMPKIEVCYKALLYITDIGRNTLMPRERVEPTLYKTMTKERGIHVMKEREPLIHQAHTPRGAFPYALSL